MEFVLGLLDRILHRLERGQELLSDNRVLDGLLYETKLGREVLQRLADLSYLGAYVKPHDEVVDLLYNPLNGLSD